MFVGSNPCRVVSFNIVILHPFYLVNNQLYDVPIIEPIFGGSVPIICSLLIESIFGDPVPIIHSIIQYQTGLF